MSTNKVRRQRRQAAQARQAAFVRRQAQRRRLLAGAVAAGLVLALVAVVGAFAAGHDQQPPAPAGPLVGLAPDFAKALVPGGHLVLAGLLETQEQAVRSACRHAGLRLSARLVNGDWSILWLRKRRFSRRG